MAQSIPGSDLSFVSCWEGRNVQDYPQSRSVKSTIIESTSGLRAYAVASAEAGNRNCNNAVRLLVAKPGSRFTDVLGQKPSGTRDGNGIRLAGWSPSGKKLAAEITDWAYGSDDALNRDILVYDSEKPQLVLWRTTDSLAHYFGGHCLFKYSATRWFSESTILLEVVGYRKEWDDRPPCVTQPTVFTFDTRNGVPRLALPTVKRPPITDNR